MTLKLTFDIILDSDYHIGAGHGQGMLIDSALQRDADGRPVLRGTTVGGLLRDGLYRLLQTPPLKGTDYVRCQASGLPESDKTPAFCSQHDARQKDCPVCALFGSPRTPRRWEISSARPVGEELPGTTRWDKSGTGSVVAPHVRVSPRTRRAEEAKLFFREEGDRRLRFRFTATCEATDASVLEQAAWLAAAARFVNHLGAGRRRGRGECSIELVDVSGLTLPADAHKETYLLDLFGARMLKLGECAGASFDIKARQINSMQDAGPLRFSVRRRVIARLDEPLIISEKGEAGNEFRGGDMIPGSVVRGALASRAAQRHNLDNSAGPAYRAFVDLFFRGQARFSSLLPAEHEADTEFICPALPAPLDLLSCALHPGLGRAETAPSHGAFGYACAPKDAPLAATCPRCGKDDMKPLSGFIPLREESQDYRPEPFTPCRVAEMHVAIDPVTQRSDAGRLFSFDGLTAGQYFVGALEFTNEAAWQTFLDLTGLDVSKPVRLRLGKALHRGYGAVTLWIKDQGAAHPWYPKSLQQRVPDLTQPFTLTCLTDTLSLDRWGRYRSGFDVAWLRRELGLEGAPNITLETRRTYAGTRGIDSHNGTIGLPRTRDIALRAGSAVGIQISGTLTAEQQAALYAQMELLERSGLGLRTVEGFGQVAFNLPVYDANRGLLEDALIQLSGLPGEQPNEAVERSQFHKVDLAGEHVKLTGWRIRLEQNWEAYHPLDKTTHPQSDPFEHAEFEAVALLLRSAASAPQLDVENLLKGLGGLERLGQGAELDTRREELAIWQKRKANVNFFRSPDKGGRRGIEELERLLRQWRDQLAGDEHLARHGLNMLADRVAAAAQMARKGESR